ncbi:ABC transporter ATP-binding protein [soil metagenome]
MTAPAVDVRKVEKVFNPHDQPVVALAGVSLSVADNEFFTLLGPSGCGKTTLLRLIAGFETATAGEILLFGASIERLPPHERPVNTVFQQYALFPHLSVFDNVAFGLEMLRKSKSDVKKTVMKMLELVKMETFASRKPAQLSGGQQQRIALARALAPHPKVLLLDEPLSALDLKLRHAMRGELKTLQRETGVTFIFVTHDQEEALTMSDRVAVMSAGEVQQIGSVTEIYEHPHNRFVADFIGRSNFLEGVVTETTATEAGGGSVCVQLSDGATIPLQTDESHSRGETVTLVLRPEKIALKTKMADAAPGVLHGVVTETMYLGTDTNFQVALAHGPLLEVRDQNSLTGAARFRVGDEVALVVAPNAARVLRE